MPQKYAFSVNDQTKNVTSKLKQRHINILDQFEAELESIFIFLSKAISQKIVAKHLGDSHHLRQIDAFSSKQLIDIRFLTIDFFCQPNNRPILTHHFRMYQFADINIIHREFHSLIHSMVFG